ncbi:MAG: right-handed parallel beta-helix repeat-containing protein [Planctomycetes bacterium]|nr:right-handed parallel beta-helix repeat-containing protein [Planctomycetota bacterium]
MNKQMFGGSRFIIAVAMVVLGALSAQALGGPVLYVDDHAPPGGDGAGWTTAHRFLQDALADASGGSVSEVRVAQGIYKPDQDEAGNVTPGDRDATFQLITGVALRGGYAGLGAPDPDERDIDLYETVLSGDLLGNDGPGFQNNDENSYTVVTGSNTDATAVLEGFTITAGNADCPYDPYGPIDPCYLGGAMFNENGSPTISNCKFIWNAAAYGGGIYNLSSSLTISECMFSHNSATWVGGAIRNNQNSSPLITGCIFVDNVADSGAGIAFNNYEGPSNPILADCVFLNNNAVGPGGGIRCKQAASAMLLRCTFIGNSGVGGGGAFLDLTGDGSAQLQGCVFTHNEATYLGGGLVVSYGTATLMNCTFTRSSSDWLGGGLLDNSNSTLINCAFSRDVAPVGGGLYTTSDSTLINCTLSNETGSGLVTEESGSAALTNCILWGNTPDQIAEDPASPGGFATVSYSDIQGGWTGPGGNNIDADPLFVQPGLDNVRLSFGSPCLNVGSNAALPPDEFDLDGDGDTDEPIPYDLDGNDRIQAGIVDMGAYEGEHEPLPPGSSDSDMDLDQGETAILIPGGGLFDPLKSAAVMFTNVSGPDNASVTITEWYQSVHPGAGGYSDLTSTLTIETSLDDGQFLALVLLPFNPDVLAGIDPFQPNLTSFDSTIGNWGLAVAGNTVNSPGFPWPIGDRVIVEGPGGYEFTQDLGDYGVYWLPSAQQGFVWANVDYAADLALGAALCPPDCRQTPDGVVDVFDILAVLTAWGGAAGGGPCDLDTNGTVDQSDLLAVLSAWGPCSQSANSQGPFVGVRTVAAVTLPSQTSRVATSHGLDRDPVNVVEPSSRGDLDGNGRVDRNDLLILRSSWGPCADGPDSCPTDLDGDGVVGVADILTLLANWGLCP